jgi:hypothetical protein
MNQNIAGGLFLICLGGLAFALLGGLAYGSLGEIGPAFFPTVAATVLGAIVVFGITIRGMEIGGLSLPPLGLAIAGPLAIMIGGFADSDTRWAELTVFALAISAFCIGLFRFALGLPIPLAPWLIGY